MNYVDCSNRNCNCEERNNGCCCAPNITVNVPGTPTPTTTAYLNAQNTGGTELEIDATGTLVPLPDNQLLEGFTANVADDTFTAEEDGVYLLTYSVNIGQQEDLASRILLNGTELEGTAFVPSATADRYSVTTLVNISEGDTISLQLYDETDTVTLQDGVGASLTLIKIA